MITLRVLGTVGASVDGHEVDLGGPARRAVLARLAVDAEHVVATDRLIEDLWHSAPPPRATATLQAHISHLRRALEPDRGPRAPSTVVARVPPGYALRAGPGLDAVRAEHLAGRARAEEPGAARATLREVLALWTGPSLGEFADEPWARADAARLDELRRVSLERLAQLELDHGGPAGARTAVELLTPHTAAHPLREEPARVLALALEGAGRRAEALAGLAELRARLADELGLDPSAAVVALEDRLRATPAPEPPPVRTSPRRAAEPGVGPGVVSAGEPVIGRDAELGRLEHVAGRVGGGAGELALVAGEAGSGKTTVLDELSRRLRARGWRTVRGRCPEVDGAPPAWAWTEVHDAVAAGSRSEPVDLDAPDGPFRLGRTLVEQLATGGVPTLITLDDLHRADDETQRLLRLVVSAAVPCVLVVAAYRGDEVDDDLVATFAALASATGERLDLAGLDPEGCAALLARHGAGGGTDPDTARRVAARTGGNPLFVREVARLVAAVGLKAARSTVPAGVRDVLHRRLAALGEPTVLILRHAAVLGRRVELEVLVELERRLRGGPDRPEPAAVEDRVLAACEAALRSGLLAEPSSVPDAWSTESVEFGHDLVREVLYSEVPRLRRGRVHAAALDVLAERRPDDRAALARHALAAGGTVEAVRVLDLVEDAARAARRAGSPRAAADLLAAAARLPATARVDAPRRLALRCARAEAAALAGAAPEALVERTAALAEAAAMPGHEPALAAVTSIDAPVSFALHEDGTIDRVLVDAAGALLAADPPLPPADRVRVHVARAFAWHPTHPDRCAEDARAAEALVDAHALAADLRCRALNARFWSELTPGRWSGLDTTGQVLLAAAEDAGSSGYRTVGHHARFLHATYRHDMAAAAAHAAAAVAEAPDGQLPVTLGWSTIFTGVEALMAGRPDDAEAVIEGVHAAMVAGGAPNAVPMRLGGLLGVRRWQGRLAELVDDVAAAHARTPALFADPFALTLLAAGRHGEAAAVWRPDDPVRGDWWWLLWTAVRAELAVGLGDREVAARCREDLLPWSGHLAGLLSGTATFGPVDLLLAELGTLLGRPATEAADLRAAADALCDRLGAPRWPSSTGAAPGPVASVTRVPAAQVPESSPSASSPASSAP